MLKTQMRSRSYAYLAQKGGGKSASFEFILNGCFGVHTNKFPGFWTREFAAQAPPHLVGTQIMVIINWLQPKLSQAVIMAQVAKS